MNISVSVSKDLLECSYAKMFHITVAQSSTCDKDRMAYKATNVYSLWTLNEKFANPWPRDGHDIPEY
jgi:hypothetical protein